MKKRIVNSVLGVLLLLAILLFPSITAKAQTGTDLSSIVGTDALCYVSVDTSEKSWSYFLKRFEGIKESKSWKGISEALQKEGFDMEKEMLGLLGEQVIFAAYPYKDNKPEDAPPPFMVAVLVKDPDLAATVMAKMLDKIEKHDNVKFTKETYSGTEISYFIEKEISPSFALNKNYIMFGSNPDVIKKVIDVIADPTKSLTTKPSFAKMQKNLSSNQAWLYFNFADIFNMLKGELDSDKDLKEMLELVKSYKEMGLGMGINEKGFKFKSCVVVDPDDKFLTKMLTIPPTDFSQITTMIPKEPLFFLAVNEFDYWLESIEKFIPDKEIKDLIDEGVKELKKFCGLDIRKDIFGNSNGIFAIFGSISAEKPIPNFAFILGLKDVNKMTNVMKNFMFDMSEGKKKDVIKFNQSLTYRGTKMMLAQQTGFIKESGIRPGYFIKDKMLILGSDMDVLKKILDLKTNNANALINYVPFISMQTRMRQKSNSLGYVDLKTILNLVMGFVGEDPEAKPFIPTIQSFKAIGFNSYNEKGWAEGIFLLDIDMDKFDFEMLGKVFEENFVTAHQQAKNSAVKANMHTVQMLVETFAVDNGGFYPKDLGTLEAEGTKNNYWKVLENPFLKDKKAIIEFNLFKEADPEFGGTVIYKPIVNEKGISQYEIFGCDEDGNLIKEEGEVFKLSN